MNSDRRSMRLMSRIGIAVVLALAMMASRWQLRRTLM